MLAAPQKCKFCVASVDILSPREILPTKNRCAPPLQVVLRFFKFGFKSSPRLETAASETLHAQDAVWAEIQALPRTAFFVCLLLTFYLLAKFCLQGTDVDGIDCVISCPNTGW